MKAILPAKVGLFWGTSLVVWWFRLCLPMQKLWVQFLAGELRPPPHPLSRGLKTKMCNWSNIITNSIKTWKMVHTKKTFFFLKKVSLFGTSRGIAVWNKQAIAKATGNTGVVAFPFSRGSSQPRDRTQVSHIAGRFFTSWATREACENGCESWTIKKAEHWRINAFELWGWRRCLRVPWTARRSNQSVLKEISPKYSFPLPPFPLRNFFQHFGPFLPIHPSTHICYQTQMWVCSSVCFSFHLIFIYLLAFSEKLFIFNWGVIALQDSVGFCHTSAWVSHRYSYAPSLLNLPPTSHPIPHHRAPDLSSACHTANSSWLSVLPMVMYLFARFSPGSSPRSFPACANESIRYVCISIAVLRIASPVPSF